MDTLEFNIRPEDQEAYNAIRKAEGIIDAQGNGAILKEVLVEGTGDVCPRSAHVKVHYDGTLLDGSKFDSSRDRGVPFEFDCGAKCQVIRGWNEGVPGMKVGEKSRFTLVPEYAYGASGSPPTIPGNAVLQFVIELLDFEEDDDEYPLENDEKIAAAEKRKTMGNDLFAKKNYSKAADKYEKATQLLENIFDADEETKKKAALLRATCFANWTLCLINTEDFVKAINKGREGLKILEDNDNPSTDAGKDITLKILTRITRAQISISAYPQAIAICDEILKIDPENRAALKYKADAQKKANEAKKREQATLKRMFSALNKASAEVPFETKPAKEEDHCGCGCSHEHDHEHEHEHEHGCCGCGCEDKPAAEQKEEEHECCGCGCEGENDENQHNECKCCSQEQN